MKTSEFQGKQVYLWGMGVEGAATAGFLSEKLPDLNLREITDDIVPPDAEIVIKSPGVSIYKDEYLHALDRGVKFTSLMNIFFAELYARSNRPAVIGITGTKGKTTTASMLAFMLEKSGHRVGLGGNIGRAPLDFLDQDLDFIILELSSFQTTSLEFSPDIVQVVSISPAHLDWHRNYENYKRDKLRFVSGAKQAYLCGYDEYLKTLNLPNARFYYKTDIPLPELRVYGGHNIVNLSGALEIIKYLGLDAAKAAAFLADFEPIDHRLKKVHEKNGLIFIDDSIATVAESTIAGIRAFIGKNIAVIVGGYDNKSANYAELSRFITENDSVKIAVGLPDTGRLIDSPKLKMAENMDRAVHAAAAALPDGGVVLLSPAAQSFNLYKNYKERGDDFARIARSI